MLLVGSWILFGGRAQRRLCPEVLTFCFCLINFESNLGRFSQNAEARLLLEMGSTCWGWAAFKAKMRNFRFYFCLVRALQGRNSCKNPQRASRLWNSWENPWEFEKLSLKSQLPINWREKRNQSQAQPRAIQPSRVCCGHEKTTRDFSEELGLSCAGKMSKSQQHEIGNEDVCLILFYFFFHLKVKPA